MKYGKRKPTMEQNMQNAIIVASLWLTMVVCISTVYAERPEPIVPEETVCEITTQRTAEEPVETTQETTKTEPPVTEAETAPQVTLYNVPLDEELQLHIINQAEAHGIDPAIIFAMAFRESSYRADAIGDGGAALGLLQVWPRWHSDRMDKLGCTDLLDPFQNVTVAVDYLAEQINRYNGDVAKALTAYNSGHYKGTITTYAKKVLATADELRGDIA